MSENRDNTKPLEDLLRDYVASASPRSHGMDAAMDAAATELQQARQEIEHFRSCLSAAHERDWTASLLDRLNEMVGENLDDLHEVEDGPSASKLIQKIHGLYNTYKRQLAARDARIAELEGGLPVTEEGDHVYLGMTVWSDGSPLDSGVVTKVQKDCYVVDRSSVGCSTWVFMSGEGYSTREAAEAARSTPDGKGGE